MSKLRIFIEGEELDSLESVTVPITKQYEELSDPTVICNDYSKTVTVPLSKRNNEIFGHCYNPDRLTAYSGDESTPLIGIYFDPYKKLDCRLQWGDTVFFVGYAKMLKVTNKGYEVTINGELGKIFQELQKITFDKSKYDDEEDIAKYWIDGSVYLNAVMNADFVKSCWAVTSPSTNLYKVGDANYNAGNIISFVLNAYKSSNYDGEKHISQYAVEQAVENSVWAEDKTYDNKTYRSPLSGVSSLLSDLSPYQLRQYRSYQELPVMYFNQFWQIFQTKAEELTGYKWQTSGSVFNSSFFKNSVFALKNYESIVKDLNSATDTKFYYTLASTYSTTSKDTYASDGTVLTTLASGSSVLNPKYNLMRFTLSDGSVTFRSYNSAGETLNRSTIYYDGESNYGYVSLSICGKPRIVWVNESAVQYAVKKFTNVIVIGVADQTGGGTYTQLTLPYNTTNIAIFPSDTYDANLGGSRLTFNFTAGWVGRRRYPNPILGVKNSGSIFTSSIYHLESTIISAGSNSCYEHSFNSGSTVTLNTFLSKGFDLILEWCKTFRVQIEADTLNKKLLFRGSDDYFNSPTIEDKTDKVDSSTFDIDLLRVDKQKFIFGQSNESSNTATTYENAYDVGYGCIKFDTGYNFGTDEQQVVTLRTPLTKQLSTYFITNLLQGSLVYDLQTPTISVEDDEGKYAGFEEGTFSFLKWANDSKGIALTDDSEFELGENKVYPFVNDEDIAVADGAEVYFTTPSAIAMNVNSYPCAVPFYNNTIGVPLLRFGIPKVTYISSATWLPESGNNIFSDYWEKYLNERYNAQNKKVTTYVRLSPMDFISFKFSQLWQIGNQIYMVNKISDYDITSDKPTKVELITIQDINNYK